jgi:carbon storage regulator
MLTLTREPGQKIVVGDDIVITVVSVSENGRVRLGIEAPRQIRIDREEVLERIQNENIEAGAGGTASRWAAYAARRANRQASAGATSPSVGDPGQSGDAAQRPKREESLVAPR